ncbi:MAG: hypothetical protein KKH94_00050 [Candidatus Omnitrophica bacterium]|nr:hypothetical protein [Candidatus Omnitrophota bacterium]
MKKKKTLPKKSAVDTKTLKKVGRGKPDCFGFDVAELSSRFQGTQNRCKKLEEQLSTEKSTRALEIESLARAKEKDEQLLKQEIEYFKKSLEEEKSAREPLEKELNETKDQLETKKRDLDDVFRGNSTLEKELSECRWYLGEAASQKKEIEHSLMNAHVLIEEQKENINSIHKAIEEKEKQRAEVQWYLEEDKVKIQELENTLQREQKHSESLSNQIVEIRESLNTSTVLAAEWMRRWDNLIQETLKSKSGIDKEQIESGRLLEEQFFNSRQEVEMLTKQKDELGNELKQKQYELEGVMEKNALLQNELVCEKEKNQSLQQRFSESEWYLGELRQKIQHVDESKSC